VDKEKHSVTLRDVADECGLSLATVSRVISGHGYASRESKVRVQEAVNKLGYRVHGVARNLKTKRTTSIGLIITDIVNPFYSELAKGVLTAAANYGYHIIILATSEKPEQETEYVEMLLQQRVAGIIGIPTAREKTVWEEVQAFGSPLVLVDREVPGLDEVDSVLVDNTRGAEEAVNYLISLGHERIAIITGPLETTTGKGRLDGYLEAHRKAGMETDAALIHEVPFTGESAREPMKKLLAMENPPTALFAANNVLGNTALQFLREAKVAIPADLSFIMFDEVPWAALVAPPITVVSQPTYEVGYVALEMIHKRLIGEQPRPQQHRRMMLSPKLVLRESAGFPPERQA
jgi:LacI family transcriptional regulator